jgi:hypothetical protein
MLGITLALGWSALVFVSKRHEDYKEMTAALH